MGAALRCGRARDRSARGPPKMTCERATAERDEYAATPRPILDVSSRDAMVVELETARARRSRTADPARDRSRAGAGRGRSREVARAHSSSPSARRPTSRLAARSSAQRQVQSATSVLVGAAGGAGCGRPIDVRGAASRSPRAKPSGRRRTRSSSRCGCPRVRCASDSTTVGDTVHGLEMQVYEKKLQLSTLLERAGEELGLVEDVLDRRVRAGCSGAG